MNIGEVCTREVYIVAPGEALTQAAREMLRRHVGAIVVVQPEGKLVLPVGIVTDRDIVREQLSRDADLRSLKVADVMSKDLLTLADTSEVSEAIERMSSKAVRRAPVVSGSGDLVGIVSLDDLLAVMMEEFSGLARLVAAQPKRERAVAQGATARHA